MYPRPFGDTPGTVDGCYGTADQDFVGRVLAGPRHIGITGRLPYKKDSDTLKGRYGKGTAISVSQP